MMIRVPNAILRLVLFCSVVGAVFQTSASWAAAGRSGSIVPAATRTRPAKLQTATLVGKVLDAADGSRVFEAILRVGSRTITAERDGSFTLEGLPPGVATMTAERWGYASSSQQLNLRVGSNTTEIRLAPKPIVVVTETNGRIHRLDYELTNFATQDPLASYAPLSPAEFCKLDGTLVRYSKSEIARVIGPGKVVQNAACCPTDTGIEVRIELKSGEAFDAVLRECYYYRYDLIGRNRETGIWDYLGFRSIVSVVFP